MDLWIYNGGKQLCRGRLVKVTCSDGCRGRNSPHHLQILIVIGPAFEPDTFNTYQGSQFTGSATGALAGDGIAISMDGKGAWREVFVQRLWRSVN